MSYQLSIVTPNGKVFEGAAQSVIVPGAEGFFEVLANHAAIVSMLKKGIVTLRGNEKSQYFAIGPGVLEVNSAHDVLLLSDFAVSANSRADAQEKLNDTH